MFRALARALTGEGGATVVSIKAEVAALLERLPEESTLEEIQYHLYVLEKVHRGLEQIDRGEGIPHAEAVARLRKWHVSE
jgi:hypothetical protein